MDSSGVPQQVDARWATARNILAVRLDNIGDVLMTTPALRAIRQSLPDADLTLLASPAGVRCAAHLPMLDAAVAYLAPWIKAGADADDTSDRVIIDVLRARRFDAAIIFTVNTQTALPAALLCKQAGIALRLAYSREPAYGLLTDRLAEPDAGPLIRHEVERQLALVAAVGMYSDDTRLTWRCFGAERRRLALQLHAAGVPQGQPYVVLHPGATAASRRYPIDRFAAVAAQLRGRLPEHRLIVAGGEDDLAAARHIARAVGAGCVDMAGRLSLAELAALIDQAALVVCNNSAPAHLAAARQTPVVCMYALTNPQHTPWQVSARVLNKDVPCRNCLSSRCVSGDQQCLAGVSPEDVVQAAIELLGTERDVSDLLPIATTPPEPATAPRP